MFGLSKKERAEKKEAASISPRQEGGVMNGTVKLKSRMDWAKGKEFDAIPWDGVLSMADGRAWYACPICGLGISGPLALEGSGDAVMVHKECIELAKES